VISYASLIAAALAFVLAAAAWRWMPASWRSRLSQQPSESPAYAGFDAHRLVGRPAPSLDPELVVGWPGEFRLCGPCGETQYVEVRDDSIRCFEHGHVTPATI
jgi:hypothetical protein